MDRARALAREALESWRGADPDHAIGACDDALAILLPGGASDALADVLRWKGSVLRDRGDHAAARELYQQSLAVADAANYNAGRGHALNCLGTVAQFRGDLPEAERCYGAAAQLAYRLMDRRLSAMVQQNLGILAEDQGRTDEAVAHFRLALVAFEQEEQHAAALSVLNNLGVLYTREGLLARAAETLERAYELAVDLRDLASEGIVEENRSTLFSATGNYDAAEVAAARAYSIAEQRRDNVRRAAALRVLARVTRTRDGWSAQTVSLLERSLSISELTEDVLLRVEVLTDLGDAYADAHERSRGKDCWRAALELARRAGLVGMTDSLQQRLRPPSARPDKSIEVTAP